MSPEKIKPIIQKIIVAGVIFNPRGEVLLLQRNAGEKTLPNLWELPGGKRELLESSNAALKREINYPVAS